METRTGAILKIVPFGVWKKQLFVLKSAALASINRLKMIIRAEYALRAVCLLERQDRLQTCAILTSGA